MRAILLLVLIANLGIWAYGFGLFGTPPSEAGREARHLTERNQHTIALGAPQATVQRP